jgi:uncharacterized membrane protein
MIFLILYIIFSRVNDYYTVTIYDSQIISDIMEYNKITNLFTKKSNYIEYDNLDRIFWLWKSCNGSLLYNSDTNYITYKYHKINISQHFYDNDFNIGGEITYTQDPIKSIMFKFPKQQCQIFSEYYERMRKTNINANVIKDNYYHMFNYDANKWLGLTVNTQLSYNKKLEKSPYFAGSIYAIKDMKYIGGVAKDLNKRVLRIGLNFKYIYICMNDNNYNRYAMQTIFIIDDLEISNLHHILNIYQHMENGLLFVMVGDEADLDKYDIRHYVNLQLLEKNCY